MSFLEPLFLVGMLGAALPLIVHLINRRKATRRQFPALKLLVESDRRTARSVKVRQWALMALRVLAVALLALALAKPFMLSEQGVTSDERMPTAVVLLVDTSASMAYEDAWAQASEEADEALEGLRQWDEVALVTTTQREVPRRLTDDHGQVAEALEALRPEPQEGDLRRAVGAARDVLATSQLPNRKVILITDGAAAGLPAARLEAGLGAPVQVRRVRAPAEEAPANLSVSRVDYEQAEGGDDAWRIHAHVKNWGAAPATDVELELELGGEVLATGRIEQVPPGEEVVYTIQHRHEGAALEPGQVRLLDADAYPLDDVFYFVFRSRSRIEALLVNGEPTSIAYDDELFFLTRALNPNQRADSGIVPTTITLEGMADRELSDFDVVVLANVPRVPGGVAARLERYVRDGGGLWITAGDQVDVAAYNSTLGELLPKPLRSLKRLTDREDPDAPVKLTRLGATNHQHPVFRAFQSPGGDTLQSARVYSYLLLEPSAPERSTTLLSYKDSAPALLERRVGEGRVLLFTTTIDFEWTDLPIRSSYLPLVQRIAQYLARRATSTGQTRYQVGERARLEVSGMVKWRVVVRGPVHLDEPARRVLEPTEGVISFEPERPGVYLIWADSDDEQGQRLDDLAFAVNVPLEESQLQVAPEGAFARWMGQGAEGDDPQASSGQAAVGPKRRVNIWPTLLFLVTLALLAETILGTRRSVLLKIWRAITGTKLASE